jgi:hypothetical protein
VDRVLAVLNETTKFVTQAPNSEEYPKEALTERWATPRNSSLRWDTPEEQREQAELGTTTLVFGLLFATIIIYYCVAACVRPLLRN